MTPPPTSNIRAFVQWRDAAVYAGEEIECVITFKNVDVPFQQEGKDQNDESAQVPTQGAGERSGGFSFGLKRTNTAASSRRGDVPTITPAPQSRRASIVQAASRAPSVASSRVVSAAGKGHRPTLSLNVVSASSKTGMRSAPLPQGRFGATPTAVRPTRGHGRSLSIMSLGSEARSGDGKSAIITASVGSVNNRIGGAHSRSASLQYTNRQTPQQSQNGGTLGPSVRQPSPLYEATSPPVFPEQHSDLLPIRPGRRRPGTMSAGNTPQLGRQASTGNTSQLGTFNTEFQFPRNASLPQPPEARPRIARNPATTLSGHGREYSSRVPPEGWSASISSLNPISRVMSESSAGGSPRTSSDLYSMSNHSDDTYTSETYMQSRHNGSIASEQSQLPSSSRVTSNPQSLHSAKPETLMMGYAQTMGSFTLDGSLINAAPFEEVKRRGVQGGGGVVGVERPKRASSMFGALSWSNIGESLGGLLGGDEMSSMAQMKASAGSKSIPLLSTPQTLLFVDLKLAPGESRSYSYRLALPRGLPPSHRGRAMKVQYHLAIGVQRPETQTVKHAEVPFRVLGSYDARGHPLGHDLMSPYVILHDTARTASVAVPTAAPSPFQRMPSGLSHSNAKTPKQGLEDFLRYTERLLEQSNDTGEALLSPSSTTTSSPSLSRRQSDPLRSDPAPVKTQDSVNLAIMRANHATESLDETQQQGQRTSGNRFNIARSGQPVAVLTILRPAYKLGEAVIGTIDFTGNNLPFGGAAQLPAYAVFIELESEEVIDPSLALRSSHSVHRVTRRTYASTRENAIFARSISFNLTIPAHATPSFETTGVSLLWVLKIEFSVQRSTGTGLGIDSAAAAAASAVGLAPGLLEELATDERGTAYIARERMIADTFEVRIPLKVYGARASVEDMNGISEGVEV